MGRIVSDVIRDAVYLDELLPTGGGSPGRTAPAAKAPQAKSARVRLGVAIDDLAKEVVSDVTI